MFPSSPKNRSVSSSFFAILLQTDPLECICDNHNLMMKVEVSEYRHCTSSYVLEKHSSSSRIVRNDIYTEIPIPHSLEILDSNLSVVTVRFTRIICSTSSEPVEKLYLISLSEPTFLDFPYSIS